MNEDKTSKTKDPICEQVFNSHFSQNEMEENELELLTQLYLKDEIISAMEEYARLYRQTETDGWESVTCEDCCGNGELISSQNIHNPCDTCGGSGELPVISSQPKEEDKEIEAIFNMSEEEIDKKLVEFGYDPRQVERNADALIAKLKAMRLFPKTKEDGREVEWISVKDRMPEEGQIVDVWEMPDTQTQNNIEGLEKTHHSSQYTGWRSTNYKYSLKLEADGLKYHSFEQVLEGYAHVRTSYDYKQLIVENGEVTHWRPLPAIPKQNPKP